MKKKFVEPHMKRIELNMTENIAASGSVYYKVWANTILDCTLQQTGTFMMELMLQGQYDLIETCKVYSADSSSRNRSGTLIPENEIKKYL